MTKEEIEKLIHEKGLTLTDVIDVVTELNGFVGVGFISFADDISNYIRQTPERKSNAHTEHEPSTMRKFKIEAQHSEVFLYSVEAATVHEAIQQVLDNEVGGTNIDQGAHKINSVIEVENFDRR